MNMEINFNESEETFELEPCTVTFDRRRCITGDSLEKDLMTAFSLAKSAGRELDAIFLSATDI
jgi:hypothetical protein